MPAKADDELDVVLRPSAELEEEALRALYVASWPESVGPAFESVRQHSLCWVSAHVSERLVGFVNVAWDGGAHAFLLDTVVHPEFRRRGVGRALVRCAVDEARELGADYVHVDYVEKDDSFYRGCGFRPTLAGLVDLKAPSEAPAAPAFGLRRFRLNDAPGCRTLMAGLSEWFSIPTAVNNYIEDLPRVLTWVATDVSEHVVGFISLTRSQPRAFEVHVLAVDKSWHGQGVGRALMDLGETFARSQKARFMQVKTLGPSHADRFYAGTRAFYQKVGYEPLFESDRFWGEGNPTLFLVKSLG